jgi:hypothetical protein
MTRNLVVLLLILYIIFSGYKLNTAETIIFYFLGICYILGNFGFYFLAYYPNNWFWSNLIKDGYLWNEFPVTITVMICLLLYIILRSCPSPY